MASDISIDGTVTNPQSQKDSAPIKETEQTAKSIFDNAEPEVEVAPKAEVETPTDDKPLVTIDDFLAAKDIETEPKILKDEKKDDKIEKTSKEEDKAKVTAQPKTTTKVESPGRDYSDIPESDHNLWRAMSNEAYNKLKPLYLEHKKVKADFEAKQAELTQIAKERDDARKGIVQVPDNYYEHPQAFVLTPEFAQASKNINLANQIYNHWRGQLKAVRGGAKEYVTVKIDDQGQLVQAGKLEANEAADEQLEDLVKGAERQYYEQDGIIKSLAQTHANKHNEGKKWIEDFDRGAFEVYEKEDNKPKVEPIIKDLISNLHPSVRNNPLARSFAKSLLMINDLKRLLTEAAKEKVEATNGKAATKAADKVKVGPTNGEAAGDLGSGKESKKTVTEDDFAKAKGNDW